MAGFEQIGANLSITVLVVNLFLAGFGGLYLSDTYDSFVPDTNITASTFENTQYGIGESSYSNPTQSQFSQQNDPFGAVASTIGKDLFGFIQTLLFGITVFALAMGAPQGLVLGVIAPINIIFLFYLISFAGSTSAGFLRSVFGG